MIFSPLTLVVLGFFIIISILDWKFKAVPSVFMTGMMFILAVVNIQNLPYAVLSLILAIILQDIDETRGIADLKATIIIGFLISTLQIFALFTILLVIFSAIYTFIVRNVLKNKDKEFPFLPVYLVVYIILMGVQVI